MSTKAELFHRGICSEVHSPITTPEIICVMALILQPIRGCPQHSGETGTRLSSAIHRRLLSRFFLREGGRLYTGYTTFYTHDAYTKYLRTLDMLMSIEIDKSRYKSIASPENFVIIDFYQQIKLINRQLSTIIEHYRLID